MPEHRNGRDKDSVQWSVTASADTIKKLKHYCVESGELQFKVFEKSITRYIDDAQKKPAIRKKMVITPKVSAEEALLQATRVLDGINTNGQ